MDSDLLQEGTAGLQVNLYGLRLGVGGTMALQVSVYGFRLGVGGYSGTAGQCVRILTGCRRVQQDCKLVCTDSDWVQEGTAGLQVNVYGSDLVWEDTVGLQVSVYGF